MHRKRENTIHSKKKAGPWVGHCYRVVIGKVRCNDREGKTIPSGIRLTGSTRVYKPGNEKE